MSKGYLIVAQNNTDTDYIACARVLAKSIRVFDKITPICLLTDRTDYTGLEIFNHVVTFPYGDCSTTDWKLDNDWQCYEASPFEQTIKIEADVIVTRNLEHWWELCDARDLLISTGTRNYQQSVATSRYYRQVFDKNCLPDVYNGLTYYRKSELAEQFYSIVRTVFENWSEFSSELKAINRNEPATTDVVYAIAAQVVGVEHCTVPNDIFQWVHMKPAINNIGSQDWTRELVWELINGDFRINTYSQLYPVHYNVKSLALELEPLYGRIL